MEPDYLKDFNDRWRKKVEESDDPKVSYLIQLSAERTPLKISYEGASEPSAIREVIPERVSEVSGFDTFYLEAWCKSRNAERLFRVDKITLVSQKDLDAVENLEKAKEASQKEEVVIKKEIPYEEVLVESETLNEETVAAPASILPESSPDLPTQETKPEVEEVKKESSCLGYLFYGLIVCCDRFYFMDIYWHHGFDCHRHGYFLFYPSRSSRWRRNQAQRGLSKKKSGR